MRLHDGGVEMQAIEKWHATHTLEFRSSSQTIACYDRRKLISLYSYVYKYLKVDMRIRYILL